MGNTDGRGFAGAPDVGADLAEVRGLYTIELAVWVIAKTRGETVKAAVA